MIPPVVSQHLFLQGLHQELGAWGLSGGVSGSCIRFDPTEVLCRGLSI